jgi:signal transduction histidine kinase
MNQIIVNLRRNYRKALREHMAGPGRDTLEQALQLGRSAMDSGLGAEALIRAHHQALAFGLPAGPAGAARTRLAAALDDFLFEALSPYGDAGGEASGARDQLLRARLEQIEELTSRNAELEEEIADQRRSEAATCASKDRYFALYQNARAMEANLRELSAQVLTAQEEERKRISRELHDEIGQALTAIDVSIAILTRKTSSDPAFQQDVADAKHLLERTMETVHNFARELRPAMLDHLGLASAFRAHILTFGRTTGIRTVLVGHPHISRLDEKTGEVLFRVAQEALNNTYRHAAATEASVRFMSAGNVLSMEISDNGRSFNSDKLAEGKLNGRLGLLGMKERVRLINGSMTIASAPGKGTRIQVELPVAARPERPFDRISRRRWTGRAMVSSDLKEVT